jgi:hypothetical protein
VKKAAELQRLAVDSHLRYASHRWNYDPDPCRKLARAGAATASTPNARAKYVWLVHKLAALDLPPLMRCRSCKLFSLSRICPAPTSSLNSSTISVVIFTSYSFVICLQAQLPEKTQLCSPSVIYPYA